MKVWMDIGRLRGNIARPMDDKAMAWLREHFPVEMASASSRYYGGALVIETSELEAFQNKFLDAGGQLV